jgi:hypothetical protein
VLLHLLHCRYMLLLLLLLTFLALHVAAAAEMV